MQAFSGYEHATKRINKDEYDQDNTDCSLRDELRPLPRIYQREECMPRLPRRRQRQSKNRRHVPNLEM